MRRTTFQWILVVCLISGFAGCSGCCDESFTQCFDIHKIELVTIDNTGSRWSYTVSDTISVDIFGLGIMVEGMDAECTVYDPSEWFIPKAQATSCPVEVLYNQQLEELEITSLFDYNEEAPAGSSLKEYFAFDDLSFDDEDLLDYTYYPDTVPYLMVIPPAFSKQQFVVSLALDNGEVVSDTTRLLWLE